MIHVVRSAPGSSGADLVARLHRNPCCTCCISMPMLHGEHLRAACCRGFQTPGPSQRIYLLCALSPGLAVSGAHTLA